MGDDGATALAAALPGSKLAKLNLQLASDWAAIHRESLLEKVISGLGCGWSWPVRFAMPPSVSLVLRTGLEVAFRMSQD